MTATPIATTTVGDPARPHRRLFAAASGMIAAAGLAGAVQLVTGTFTPPVSDLEPLGLTSWTLPGLWLAASVAVPWAVASWAAVRRRAWAPTAVLVASGLLLFELAVQIPFVGFSPIQPVMGAAAVALGLVARHDRATWR